MTPAEKFITLKLITESKITSFGKQEFSLTELLTEFSEKQASFLASNSFVSGNCQWCGFKKENEVSLCNNCFR